MGPCHHGMGRPHSADLEHDLKIRWIAANIFSKEPWMDDKGWSSSLGVGGGLTILYCKNNFIKCYVGSKV
jgi:hypothetical protein